MLYKLMTFRVEVPVEVDWGDGNIVSYPAGVVNGIPVGEVTVTSNEPVEEIQFISDTFAKVKFENAPDYKYANELFKNKHNIQVVYFDQNSPIITLREAFLNSGIIYHADLAWHRPRQLQYLHLHAHRLQCIEGLNTTNAFNAYDMFRDTPNLQHPRPFEIVALEDTDNGGCRYENTFQCIYPVYHNDTKYDDTNIPTELPTHFDAPEDYTIKLTWDTEINSDRPRAYDAWKYGNAHIDTTNKYLVLDGSGDYVGTRVVTDRDFGTMMVWVYRRQDGRNYDTVFCDSNTANRNICWIPSDNKIWFQLDDNQKGRCSSTTSVPVNTWTHIAVTYSTTDVVIYMNGQPVGKNDNVAFDGNFWQNDRDWLFFGGNSYATDFYGYMKLARHYHRTLEPQEVLAIYNEEL